MKVFNNPNVTKFFESKQESPLDFLLTMDLLLTSLSLDLVELKSIPSRNSILCCFQRRNLRKKGESKIGKTKAKNKIKIPEVRKRLKRSLPERQKKNLDDINENKKN